MWGSTYHTLVWYGTAAMSMIVDDEAASPDITVRQWSRLVEEVESLATDDIRLTILKGMFIENESASVAEFTDVRLRGRIALDVDISARPSADDIAQAVWGASQRITEQTGSMARAMRLLAAISANRVITDPSAGTYTVYDDDNVTVLASGALWQDAAGTIPYAGAGAERRDRLS